MNDIKQQTRLSEEAMSSNVAKTEEADSPSSRRGPADIYLDAIARAAKARRTRQQAKN